jgi:hypothetical protein
MITEKTLENITLLLDLEELKSDDRNIIMINRLKSIKKDIKIQLLQNNHKIY